MDLFGEHWEAHEEKIEERWRRAVGPEDLVLVPGDISWAMRLEEARAHLERIGSWPGLKVMVRGNHDYWWQAPGKVKAVLPRGMHILQNDALLFGDLAVAGTRGWTCPGDETFSPEDEKIYLRELGRLELSLSRMPREAKRRVAVLHFPPVNGGHEDSGFTELLERHRVDLCVYGHLHGEGAHAQRLEGPRGGVRYELVAADFLDFEPLELKV